MIAGSSPAMTEEDERSHSVLCATSPFVTVELGEHFGTVLADGGGRRIARAWPLPVHQDRAGNGDDLTLGRMIECERGAECRDLAIGERVLKRVNGRERYVGRAHS